MASPARAARPPGRGTKGQRSRGGARSPRLRGWPDAAQAARPQAEGFNNPFRVEYAAVNLDTLEELADRFEDGAVTPESLVAAGAVRKGAYVKVLGRGELSRKLTVEVHAVSKTAEAAITAAGGYGHAVPLPFKGENKAGRPAAKGNQFTNR